MPKLVLIVDDDPAQRRILEETIRRLGHETRCATGGGEALKILEGPDRASIALVLLDHVMPGMDGMEVLRRVAPKPGNPPVIMQTAHGSIDAAINAMRAGAVDFVLKPTSPDRLEVSINSALKIEALQGEIARIKKSAEGTLAFGDLIGALAVLHANARVSDEAAKATMLAEGASLSQFERIWTRLTGRTTAKT